MAQVENEGVRIAGTLQRDVSEAECEWSERDMGGYIGVSIKPVDPLPPEFTQSRMCDTAFPVHSVGWDRSVVCDWQRDAVDSSKTVQCRTQNWQNLTDLC
jgi:hypothetical protein